MSVYDIKELKDGVSSQGIDSTPGETNLYNDGYLLEIEHVPTGYKVKFPAYLDNFSDAYTQSWNAEDVYGRMDPIAVYQNTRRAIAVAWHVPANSFSQAKDNMDVINTLMTFMYPSYSKQGKGTKGGVLNMSPLVRVKFANLIHNAAQPDLGLLGYLNGFTVDVRSEEGMFMSKTEKGASVYPKTVTLNMELNVLHEHAMGWTSDGPEGEPVLRESQGGYPYRTDKAVPSTNNAPPDPPTPPANQNSSTPQPGGGASQVLGGPGGSVMVADPGDIT